MVCGLRRADARVGRLPGRTLDRRLTSLRDRYGDIDDDSRYQLSSPRQFGGNHEDLT